MSNPILDEYQRDPVDYAAAHLNFKAHFDTPEKRAALKDVLAVVMQHAGDADATTSKINAIAGGWDTLKRFVASQIGIL